MEKGSGLCRTLFNVRTGGCCARTCCDRLRTDLYEAGRSVKVDWSARSYRLLHK